MLAIVISSGVPGLTVGAPFFVYGWCANALAFSAPMRAKSSQWRAVAVGARVLRAVGRDADELAQERHRADPVARAALRRAERRGLAEQDHVAGRGR